MRRAYLNFVAAGLAGLGFAACTREAIDETPGKVASEAAPAGVAPAASVAGWRTDADGYALYNKVLPAFTAPTATGESFSTDMLRDRWTILALWGLWSDDSLAETPYLNAIASAAGQDPDLDVQVLHVPPPEGSQADPFGAYLSVAQGLKDQGGSWPLVVDGDGAVSKLLGSPKPPLYLLVGPDLTIEAWRGGLNGADPDGIKPMFRGVAEIRKMVGAPG